MAQQNSNIPPSINLMEVAPRDGLQNESQEIATQKKIEFIENLVEAGARRIEITAFVSPTWIPSLADHVEVALGVTRKKGVSYAALTPNVRGYERAKNALIDEVSVVIAASNTHNEKNLNGSTEKVLERYRELAQRAMADKTPFRAYISCAFGCPYEGFVDQAMVLKLASELLSLGAYEIAISDTIGVANPLSTMNMLDMMLKNIPASRLALHFHDTRGLALANIFSALLMGISSYDASAGGMGGCPYAPGASGNVATEDFLAMCMGMGVLTGMSLEKYLSASLHMEKILKKQLPSKMVAVARSARASS